MQNKSIELTQSQLKAYENGATMFIVPIDDERVSYLKEMYSEYAVTELLEDEAPIQKGDKDIWVKHDIVEWGEIAGIPILNIPNTRGVINFIKAKEITKEQSRYTISECIGVKVVRTGDIKIFEAEKIVGSCREFFKDEFDLSTNIGISFRRHLKTLSENPSMDDYAFLIEVKR